MMGKKKSGLRKLFLIILLCVCAAVIYMASAGRNGHMYDGVGSAAGSAISRQETFGYVALGDSIPNGYSAAKEDGVTPYPQLLAGRLEEEWGRPVNLSVYTKNGLTTGGLSEKFLSDEEVQESLRKADLITVTIGANDILKKFRKLYRDLFGKDASVLDTEAEGAQAKGGQDQDIRAVFRSIQKEAADNPKLLAKAAIAIYKWDCDKFEDDWRKAMEEIAQNRKDGAKVIVTLIYNPAGEMKALGLLNKRIAALIDKMNSIILENAGTYGYQAVELPEIRSKQYLQPDGLHPSQEGQELIMDKIVEIL